jgi:hypothetical protein
VNLDANTRAEFSGFCCCSAAPVSSSFDSSAAVVKDNIAPRESRNKELTLSILKTLEIDIFNNYDLITRNSRFINP